MNSWQKRHRRKEAKITAVGRKAWYYWDGGKRSGPPTANTKKEMNGASRTIAQLSQDGAQIPDWMSAHVPTGIPDESPPAMKEKNPLTEQHMESEEISARLKEMLRFQKKLYNPASV